MLIKSDKRITTNDGKETFKIYGIVIHMHNRFFSGQIILKFKYGYRELNRNDSIRHDISYANSKGFNTKFLEFTLVTVPKGK